MSFVTALALFVGVLVGAPLAAHLFRRRRSEEVTFAPTRLVDPSPPAARRRSKLEDRALFAVRALSVLALAVLGATPLVRCSKLSLARKGGASVALAIVLDDSLSMRAPAGPGARPRFELARESARELLDGLESGDSVAIVLAGKPARVALATTPDLTAARETLAKLGPSDRATDLDGALALARGLVGEVPQPDRRVVLFSDLADGSPDGPELGEVEGVTLWAPLPSLVGELRDCAVLSAQRAGAKARARVACAKQPGGSPEADAKQLEGRTLELREGDRVLSVARESELREAVVAGTDVTLDVPEGAGESLVVSLRGDDAIDEDDHAPVMGTLRGAAIGVVSDAAESGIETGGASPVEQALTALELGVAQKPMPSPPERADELLGLAGLVLDDTPGLTPEARRALATFFEKGGVALVGLGPRAASAPLGTSFEPAVKGVVRWDAGGAAQKAKGASPTGAAWLGPSAGGLTELEPTGRAVLDPATLEGAEILATWSDGAPLLVRRQLGPGAVLISTLPFGLGESDLPLRPAFLSLLERFVGSARARGGELRVEVGASFRVDGASAGKATRVPLAGEPALEIEAVREGELGRITPPRAGLYELEVDGVRSRRVATLSAVELDGRPRRLHPAARAESHGGAHRAVDASPYVAGVLLALFVLELGLRLFSKPREEELPAPEPARPASPGASA